MVKFQHKYHWQHLPTIQTYLATTTTIRNHVTMLTAETKNAFSTWNGLLNATRHLMELSKCSCYLQFWQFQEDGYAFTEDPATHGQEIRVKDQDGQLQLIPQLRSNESQKLLGVMKNPMGDQQDEIELLKQKSDNIAKRINSNRISWSDA